MVPKAAPTLGPGGTLPSTLQVIGNELVLEVNSGGRLKRARAWLEQIPGVGFTSVQSKDILIDPSPLDDRLPGPEPDIPPANVTAMLRDRGVGVNILAESLGVRYARWFGSPWSRFLKDQAGKTAFLQYVFSQHDLL